MEPKISRINVHGSSIRHENTFDLVDRISSLPDSILEVILSNIPTKNAVATTILSKRWKSVWMTVHNFDFCYDPSRRDEYNDRKFLQFVNRVLLLHGCGLLINFRLVCNPMGIYLGGRSWKYRTENTRNVHELFIPVENRYPWKPQPLEMPIRLFKCESLQSLELNGAIYVSTGIVVSLPKLESLILEKVVFCLEEILQKLINGCSMLKYLHLDLDLDKGIDDVFTYRISSPNLRRLYLSCDKQYYDLKYILELEASSLEYFTLNGCVPKIFVKESLSSLVEADFSSIVLSDHDDDIYNSLVEGIRFLFCAKALTLSADVLWALGNATISLSTKFSRLTKLKAYVDCCYCCSLLDFIQSSDSLEVMTIYKETNDENDDYIHDHSDWTVPVEVPKCLSNNLKEVSFEGYTSYVDEREIIGYLLKHGSALEVMRVTCDKYNKKGINHELVKEISSFPRKSLACKVECICEQH